MMPTLYMLRGLPASGKTTLARRMIDEQGCRRVNRDELRSMLDDGAYSPEREHLVKAARDCIIVSALRSGFDVVVDDTNLKPADESGLRFLVVMESAQFKIIDVDAPLEECIVRDAWRAQPVGEKVIREMHERFLAAKDSA